MKFFQRQHVSGDPQHVAVIGAGLAGLTAGLQLLGAGKTVTILEAQDHVGGRCATEELTSAHGRFAADTGATVLTMPSLVTNAIAAVGLRVEDLILPDGTTWDMQKLTPAYRMEFASGRHCMVFSDPNLMAAELTRFATDKYRCTANDPRVTNLLDGYAKHRQWAQTMFRHSYHHFLAADFDSPLDLFRTTNSALSLAKLLRIGAFRSLQNEVSKHIQDDELQRIFTFQALYAGQSPKQARAVYSVISHMDTSMGVFYPAWGIGDAARFMAHAFEQAGGTLLLNTRVRGVERVANHVTHLRTDHARIAVDAVVNTAENSPLLFRRPKRMLRTTYSPSVFLLHGTIPTAISSQWPGQAHHTLSFGAAWDEVFTDITAPPARGRLMRDPSLLITRPARTNPARIIDHADGPCEPLSILAPAPNLQSAAVDWDHITESYAAEILSTLEDRGYVGLRENVALARIDTPASYAAAGYPAGSPLSLAHSLWQTGPFRPRNFIRRSGENVVHAGSATTPGVGVPTVLLSGALAARRITRGGIV